MFGLKDRAQKRAAQEAIHIATVELEVHAELSKELAETLASILERPDVTEADGETARLNVAAIQRGYDAVLLDGADAFAADFAVGDQNTRKGAMWAHSARNMALIVRKQ